MSLGDSHTFHMKGIGTFHIKLLNGMMRELKDMRYVPQLKKKNMISIGALKAQRLRETLKEGILKMFSDSSVVLKSIQCNNLYYLKGSAVI